MSCAIASRGSPMISSVPLCGCPLAFRLRRCHRYRRCWLRSTRRDCNSLPIFPLQNADIGWTSKNTDNIFPNIHSPAFRRNCHSQVHNSPRIHVGIPLSAISLPDCCTFSCCPGKSGEGIFSDSSRCGIGIEVVPASRSGSSNTVEL